MLQLMKGVCAGLALAMMAALTTAAVGQSHSGHAGQHVGQGVSKYAGQDQRAIKSLSPDDIAELRRGGGWGLAKIAELNGVPGPIHLLEMKDKIGLTTAQVAQIRVIYQAMRAKAQVLGRKFIDIERALDDQFRTGTISKPVLKDLLARSARVRMELRETHLAAHLQSRPILSRAQIEQYNQVRGYGQADRCATVPKGHDRAMWRKHHGCK